MAYIAHTRRTKIREGERENLPGNKSPRAPFQHPGHSANKATWQRTAGRGDARDWPVSARMGGVRGVGTKYMNVLLSMYR